MVPGSTDHLSRALDTARNSVVLPRTLFTFMHFLGTEKAKSAYYRLTSVQTSTQARCMTTREPV
jgi:hypothetical protein